MKLFRYSVLLMALFVQPLLGQEEERPATHFNTHPPAVERAAAARLSRLRSVRMWWGEKNHVLGVSAKGSDANDSAVVSVGKLSSLRSLVLVALADNQLTDQGMAAIVPLRKLELLSVTGSRLGDDSTPYIGQLTTLRTLILNGPFTDQGIPALSALTQLEQLDLAQTEVTDKGLHSLAQNPKLTTLILNGTRISNGGIADLQQKFPELETLYLGDTAVDDGAVKALTSFTKMETLLIRNTRITATGLDALRQAWTYECKIIHQSGTFEGLRKQSIAMARAEPSHSTWHAVHRER